MPILNSHESNQNPLKQFSIPNQNTVFIPVYQRNNDWKEEHCRQLFLKNLYSAGFKVHNSGRESDRFVFRKNFEDIESNRDLLRELFVEAYGCCGG